METALLFQNTIYIQIFFVKGRPTWGPSWGTPSPAPSSSASPPGGWSPSSGNAIFTNCLADFWEINCKFMGHIIGYVLDSDPSIKVQR